MTLQKYTPHPRIKRRKNLWFERMMAIAASANLALVVFDLTYVSWRNFWLQGNIPIPLTTTTLHVPLPQMDCPDRSARRNDPPRTLQQSAITCLYDPIKGIQPHRDTQLYLETVDALKELIFQQGVESGLKSSEAQELLTSLRQRSTDMVTLNPFEAAGKSGTLEKIKNEMRDHVGDRVKDERSAIEAFNLFWSTDNPIAPNYLSAKTWKPEITWFDTTLRPLMATNYFRSISENGGPTNHFWILDAPFVVLFLLEFVARTFVISRRYTSLNWLDAMIWRWYDIPLFIPFSLFIPVLALLRAIPTFRRLHEAELIDLHEINAKIREGFVGAIAEEITEVVIVQVVNQVQGAIRRGELSQLLEQSASRRYVDINNVNEIEEISKHLIQLVVYQTLPKVQAELEELLTHSIGSVLNQSPAYRGLTALPGIGTVPHQITERIVSDVVQVVYNSLKAALEDETTAKLAIELAQKFSHTLISEARQQENLEELQQLLTDLLEEIKINYIQRLSEEDVTLVLDQTRTIKQMTHP